jgi:iron complex outermembrane receptor protein
MSTSFFNGKEKLLLLSFFCCLQIVQGQDCDSRLQLRFSTPSAEPVRVRLIHLSNEQTFTFKEQTELTTLCSGQYRIVLLQEGYVPFDSSFTLQQSLALQLPLLPMVKELKEVEIHDDRLDENGFQTLSSTTLQSAAFQVNAGKPLGEMLKEVSGVTSLQSGPTISKPIIHGLHSNRILLINNGIRLEGQQWGAEHAPEIDPFTVGKVTVLKGAAGLRFGSDAIAGVVLLEPYEFNTEKGSKADVRLLGSSNGQQGGVSARLERTFGGKFNGMGIRLQGTLKNAGNVKTPTYYLANTGMREKDASLLWQLNRKRLAVELSGAVFSSHIGVFSGSHVGNLDDLLAAFSAAQPLDSAGFTRSIQRGFQQVQHASLKGRVCYHFSESKKLEAVYGVQQNRRKEYDAGLPFSADPLVMIAPQADFKISTHTFDLLYSSHLWKQYQWTLGSSFITQGNVFQGLEYRALIPNYRNYGSGAFAALTRQWKKWKAEAGLRYDYRWLECYRLDYTTLESYAVQRSFSNWSFSSGASYTLSKKLSLNLHAGSAWRAPNVNELYGNGVHQSAASFEIGDSTLTSERAYQISVSSVWETEKSRFELGFYRNQIDHFIYLRPLLQPIVTIAGTYPAFQQTQVNAVFSGMDVDAKTQVYRGLKIGGKLALIQGINRSTNEYLVYTPPTRADVYVLLEGKAADNGVKPFIRLSGQYCAKQTHVPLNSDYVAPPAAYYLMHLDAGMNLGKKHPIELGFSVWNMLNTSYREYLNRFRYFANEQGRSFVLKLHYTFQSKS